MLIATAVLAGTLVVGVLACNVWVITAAKPYVYNSPTAIPANDVGLVLGTSPLNRSGGRNAHYQGRMESALLLYRRGALRHLLLSGANPSARYNEPKAMYQTLATAGVPKTDMTLDFAGFRTLDSVVRARAVFGLDEVTIVSQRYHVYRAVFLARRVGLDAVAYAAPTMPRRRSRRTEIREVFARVKAVIDLYIIRKQPKFLGEQEVIDLSPPESDPSNGDSVSSDTAS